MWIEMSQYIPNTAVISETPSIAPGSDAKPATPDTRSANAARRETWSMRPLRCAATIASIAPVTIIAATVAPITWPMAAPPAGGDALPLDAASAGCASTRVAAAAAPRTVVMRVIIRSSRTSW
jgi:hypothetical protein